MDYKLITPPSGSVISVADVKSQIGIFFDEKDSAIESYIEVAIEVAERFTGRQLLTATWEVRFPCWQYQILLKKCPIQQIVSINYYDLNNQLTEINKNDIDSVAYDLSSEPAVIWFPDRFYTYERPDAVQIRFTSGYDENTKIPKGIISAIVLMVGKRVENPVDSVENLPKASINLLRNYRL